MADLNFGTAQIPEGWTINASINLVGPPDVQLPGGRTAKQPMFPNVNVTIAEHDNEAPSAETLGEEHLAKLEQQLPKFRLIDRGELERADGARLPFLSYTFAPQPRLMVKQVQTLERRGAQVVYVTATAPAATFDRHWETLKAVMGSYLPKS